MAADLTRKVSRRLERRYSVRSVSESFGKVEAAINKTPTAVDDPQKALDSWVHNMDLQFTQSGGFFSPDCPHAYLNMLESPFFEYHRPSILKYMLAFSQQKITRRMAWIVHLLALGAVSLYDRLLTLLVQHSIVTRLKTYITRDYDINLKFPALVLLTDICCQEVLPAADFAVLNESFVAYLLYMIEKTRYSHEQCNEAASKLVLAIHKQGTLRLFDAAGTDDANGTTRHHSNGVMSPKTLHVPALQRASARSQSTTMLSPLPGSPAMTQRSVSTSGHTSPEAAPSLRVIHTICRERDNCMTFAENLIFILNREVDPDTTLLVLDFIHTIVTTPGSYTLFFTNDLCVLIDVIIRELHNLPPDADVLRLAYLRLVAPIILNTQYCQTRHKAAHLATLLRTLTSQRSLAAASPALRRTIMQTVKLCEDPLAYGPLM
ncbi:pre-rRNA processing [Dimargaris verticillata]|uniref:Pre-rRNA processing n=1 Tax=Dimargaris verticillata TaxID=2761393 RepID=A0A9W8B055_9FUNG|nr:pre-rRNA processing [Dimargaris verticillata]